VNDPVQSPPGLPGVAAERDVETGGAGGATRPGRPAPSGDRVIELAILSVEYGIVAGLLLVSAVVLVETVVTFVGHVSSLPESIVPAIDGILVVIILLDVVHTVFRHLRSLSFAVRPFLVIGILAGVRDILSSSARLALNTHITSQTFDETLAELGVGAALVIVLLGGLIITRYAGLERGFDEA
jgi:hypothetical protein